MDYSDWTQRASRFLRNITRLPGPIAIDDAIEAPASEDRYLHEWLLSEQCSLPNDLKRFIAIGSRRCCFGYHWTPDSDTLADLNALLASQLNMVVGGADLCEAYRFINYDNRDWLNYTLPSLMAEAASSLADALPPDIIQSLPGLLSDGAESGFKDLCENDNERPRGRIVIASLPDGALALEVESGLVVHLSSGDQSKRHELCSSFDEFLVCWEQIYYLTPTMENLMPWLDSTGRFAPDSAKAFRLRAFISAAAQRGD